MAIIGISVSGFDESFMTARILAKIFEELI